VFLTFSWKVLLLEAADDQIIENGYRASGEWR
jgi:hypothetical protein